MYKSISQYNSQDSYQQQFGSQQYNAFDKNIWGPKTWDMMHTFSYNYSVDPPLQMKQNAFNFYTSIGWLLPCNYCQDHCLQYVQHNPPNVENRNTLIEWVRNFS